MIKVINRHRAGRLINFPRNPFGEGSWVLISISDRAEVPSGFHPNTTFAEDMLNDYIDNRVLLASHGLVDTLFIAFDDSEPGEPGDWDHLDKIRTKRLVEFIHKNLDKNFVVHCNAGISRSGAVGEFLSFVKDEAHEFYKNFGTRIHPNFHVKNMLRWEWKELTGDLVF